MARDIARAKGCQGINQYLIIGPFGYLTALAMPDFKSQMYLKSIAIDDRPSLESELKSILDNPNSQTQFNNRYALSKRAKSE